jgi:(p)ppGpp synthase/HD superfamily hydrolase
MRPAGSSDVSLSFAKDLSLTRDALAFASDRHRSQRRSSDGAQFIAHPAEVAAMLRRCGYRDAVVAAAVLHDVLEDTDAQPSDLEARFGPEVAGMVALVSDDPRIDDEEAQKDEVRERVRTGGPEALAVYAADKISKVRELRMLMAGGVSAEQAETKRRRYRRSLSMLEREHADERLVELLRFELEALESLPPAAAGGADVANSGRGRHLG